MHCLLGLRAESTSVHAAWGPERVWLSWETGSTGGKGLGGGRGARVQVTPGGGHGVRVQVTPGGRCRARVRVTPGGVWGCGYPRWWVWGCG